MWRRCVTSALWSHRASRAYHTSQGLVSRTFLLRAVKPIGSTPTPSDSATPSTAAHEGTDYVACDLCKATFVTDMALLDHVNVVHLQVKCDYTEDAKDWTFPAGMFFVCKHCPNMSQHFKQVSALLNHYTMKHPKEKWPKVKSEVWAVEPHKCTLCPLVFVTEERLQSHMWGDHKKGAAPGKKEKKDGPFRCEDCTEKKFFSNEAVTLFQHILQKHGEEAQRDEAGNVTGFKTDTGLFDCFYCSQQMKTLSSLALHIEKVHADKNVMRDPEVFKKCFYNEGFEILQCNACKSRFLTRDHLYYHRDNTCHVIHRR